MPYDTLINGREFKLPLHVDDVSGWHVLDADDRFVCYCDDEYAVAQLIVDTFNAQYRESLEKAADLQRRAAYHVSRIEREGEWGRTCHQETAASLYATARDILGITENP